MVIILAGIVAISFLLKACDSTTQQPDVTEAAYVVHVDNRYLLTNSYDKDDTRYYLNGWWDKNGTTWKYHSYRLPLLISAYKTITIEPR